MAFAITAHFGYCADLFFNQSRLPGYSSGYSPVLAPVCERGRRISENVLNAVLRQAIHTYASSTALAQSESDFITARYASGHRDSLPAAVPLCSSDALGNHIPQYANSDSAMFPVFRSSVRTMGRLISSQTNDQASPLKTIRSKSSDRLLLSILRVRVCAKIAEARVRTAHHRVRLRLAFRWRKSPHRPA
jgi:hypothetical protein